MKWRQTAGAAEVAQHNPADRMTAVHKTTPEDLKSKKEENGGQKPQTFVQTIDWRVHGQKATNSGTRYRLLLLNDETSRESNEIEQIKIKTKQKKNRRKK